MAKTIIVSNRLPIKIKKEKNEMVYMPSEGDSLQDWIYLQRRRKYLGRMARFGTQQKQRKSGGQRAPKGREYATRLPKRAGDLRIFTKGLATRPCGPTFITSISIPSTTKILWKAYQKVNKKFAAAIEDELEEGDYPLDS